jgi:hypothetical protein
VPPSTSACSTIRVTRPRPVPLVCPIRRMDSVARRTSRRQ